MIEPDRTQQQDWDFIATERLRAQRLAATDGPLSAHMEAERRGVTVLPAGTPFGAHVAELGSVWAEAHHALGAGVAGYQAYLRDRAAVRVTA